MKYSELKAYTFSAIERAGLADYYLKSEADKVIEELEDKCRMHDFFWDGCSFAKRGFKNTIDVANYVEDLKRQIEFLKETTGSCKDCCKCADGMGKVFNKELDPLKDRLRHHKYNRCLAMVRWCDEAYKRECGLNPEELTDKEFYKQLTEFWPRWSSKWMELAEKFKEAK